MKSELEFGHRTGLNPTAIKEAEFDFREYNNDESAQSALRANIEGKKQN